MNNSDPSGMFYQTCPSEGEVSQLWTCAKMNVITGFQGGWVYRPVFDMASQGDFQGSMKFVTGQVLYALQQTYVNVYLQGNQSSSPTGYASIGGRQVALNAYGGPQVTNLTTFDAVYYGTALAFDAAGVTQYVDNTMAYIFAQSNGAISYEAAVTRADIIHILGEYGDWALTAYIASAEASFSPSSPTVTCLV